MKVPDCPSASRPSRPLVVADAPGTLYVDVRGTSGDHFATDCSVWPLRCCFCASLSMKPCSCTVNAMKKTSRGGVCEMTPTMVLMLHVPICGLASVLPSKSACCTETVSASAARSSVPSTR